MKRVLTLLGILLVAGPVYSATPSLKDNMKQLGGLFHDINATVNDPAHNADNAERASKMQEIFAMVLEQVPDSISELPPEQRDDALAGYKKIIQEELEHAQALQLAFLNGDNRAAADICNHMNLDRKEGHDKYRKNG
jgi:hypothetical protein